MATCHPEDLVQAELGFEEGEHQPERVARLGGRAAGPDQRQHKGKGLLREPA
eukprot:CAMPEP_0171121190 /NCGR_PEP_ID=MMETSP0766_2-20121228/101782_1 /TAXON_ID=439317 /ORGANISM="Gambierdiscus australes, Strain CAWD 149" /LENGTH=51 /DNA_ID=CAMNT_0011583959 /DNA_START=360 /DNA_END=512 /DNA_ORIENTATION=+